MWTGVSAAVGSLGGSLLAWAHVPDPSAAWASQPALARSSVFDPKWVPRFRPAPYQIVPTIDEGPSAEGILEQRLGALAAVREQITTVNEPVDFDVEGLADDLSKAVERAVGRAQVSVHVRDLESQHVLFDYYGDTPLIPASNQKVLTSAAGLDLLGEDYTFATEVALEDQALVLIGEGDPVLDHDQLTEIAQEVVDSVDLASIERLIVDDSAFSDRRFGPGYAIDGLGAAYQAPSGALSLDFNSIEVEVVGGQRGVPPDVFITPPSTAIEVFNDAKTGRRSARTTVRVQTRAEHGKTVVEVHGTIGQGRSVLERRRVGDPGLFTGGAFAVLLAELSESEPLVVERGVATHRAQSVLVHESEPLLDVLDRGMAYSNNFIAEQVLRTMAWELTGNPGDWRDGRDVLYGYWNLVIDREGVVIENGSGLSRDGRLTTTGLVDLISIAYRAHNGLIETLPVAGEPGTLRSRLRRSGKRVRAKTGTLDGVSGLTGVITLEDGTPQVAFSILINVRETGSMFAAARRSLEDQVVLKVLHALDTYETAKIPG